MIHLCFFCIPAIVGLLFILKEILVIHRCFCSLSLLVGMVFILTGCGKSAKESPPIGDPKVLFDMHCSKCHAQAGETGGPKLGSSKAPNLTHIGSEPGRNAEWIANYIRDPKSQKPDSRMPKFEGPMKEEEIQTLAHYLAERK